MENFLLNVPPYYPNTIITLVNTFMQWKIMCIFGIVYNFFLFDSKAAALEKKK